MLITSHRAVDTELTFTWDWHGGKRSEIQARQMTRPNLLSAPAPARELAALRVIVMLCEARSEKGGNVQMHGDLSYSYISSVRVAA